MPPIKKVAKKSSALGVSKVKHQINILNTPFLVIVESPSKCMKIEKYLGFQYKCIASKGHIREIKKISSSKKNYEPIFEIIKEKEHHVSEMREIISQFSPENIYLASDDDREGEAISWHICKTFGLSIENTHRILFHEITEPAIQYAIQHPIKIRMNIVYAQHARQVLDRLVGFQISPILSKRLVHVGNSYLSAGRCQTPALRIIYEKEMREKNTTPKLIYKTSASFFSHFPSFEFQLNHSFEKSEDCVAFLQETNLFNHLFSLDSSLQSDKKIRSIAPPTPFNTSQLLQSVSNSLHYSPKQTMMYCQTLYQGGYITYMRTESQTYAASFLSQMKEFIITEFENPYYEETSQGNSYLGSFFQTENFSQNKNAESIINAHEAIRVTNINVRNIECDTNTDPRINALYKFIWKNTLASCMCEYKYDQTDLSISAPQSYIYQAKLEMPLFIGWKRVFINEKEYQTLRETQSQIYLHIKSYNSAKTSNIKPIKINMKISMTEKTRHYTEAGLIKQLEEYGIGRPSTYALLVDTIQDRGYVKKMDIQGEKIQGTEYESGENNQIIPTIVEKTFGQEKNKLVLQELGKQTIEFLIPNYSTLFSYDYTKHLEEQLDDIARETPKLNKKWYDICKECDDEIQECTKPLKEEMNETYQIDESNIFMFGKNGGVIKHTNADGTTEYKSVKKDEQLDIQKLKDNKYTLEDLLEIPHSRLGNYEGYDMYLKTGPYGAYVEWGDKRESIRQLIGKTVMLSNITLEMVISYLEKKPSISDSENSKNTIRILRPNLSIRTGKYGPYLYYVLENGKSACYSLKKFRGGYKICDPELIIQWMTETYGVI